MDFRSAAETFIQWNYGRDVIDTRESIKRELERNTMGIIGFLHFFTNMVIIEMYLFCF
jgi:hypothetical protein